jgi:hypothetical protein
MNHSDLRFKATFEVASLQAIPGNNFACEIDREVCASREPDNGKTTFTDDLVQFVGTNLVGAEDVH